MSLFLAVLFSLPISARAFQSPKQPEVLESPLASDPMQTTVHRLSNGLTVYLSPNTLEPRISAWIAVRAGSKHDPAESTGMAHYLEHMLFKGTSALGTTDFEKEKPHLDKIVELYEKHFQATDPEERARIYKEIDAENMSASKYAVPNEIDKAYRRLGTKGLNAFTSDEQTVFVNNFPANHAEAWAKLESERFARPVFRLFQSELEVVYEEKNRSMDNAERLIEEALDKQLYKFHPYGQYTTLGSIEHLKNPSLAKMYAYFDKNYIPNNMAVAMSGDFDRKAMLALLEKYFGGWKPKDLPEAKTWPLPKPHGVERVEVKYEAEEKVMVAWPTVAYRDPDEDALTVMDMLMDNASAGIINLTLNQAQKVKSAGSQPQFHNDAGAWIMTAVPKKDQTLEEAEALLLGAVATLKAGDFSENDIRAVVTNFEIGEKEKLESNDSRVSNMIGSFSEYRPWPETADFINRVKRVTKADVVRVANKYLGDDRVVAYRRKAKPELPSIAKPNFTKIDIDASRESAFFKELMAMPAPPLEPRWLVDGKDYEITPLPSGKLYAARNPVNDLFSLSYRFDFGSRQERRLCSALELLGLSGAGALSAEEFKKKLYALGTHMGTNCSEQQAGVYLTGLNENLGASLKLLGERLEDPAISSGTLKKMIEVALGAHQDNKKNPGYIHYALSEFAKRGAQSTVLAELSDKELSSLQEEDLRKLITHLLGYFHRTAYVGNRPSKELARMLGEGSARYKTPPERVPVRYQKPPKDAVFFTHRDMVQAQVGLYGADELFAPEHSVDYQFFTSYMGGGMSAVIFQEIREARSLAYSAGGGYSQGGRKDDENMVTGGLGCQADKTVDAAALLRRLLKSPPYSDKRFFETAKAIEEDYRTNPIRFRSIPAALMGWEDQGITGDPRPERFAKSLAYTRVQLEDFAKRFHDKPMTLYILGHRDRVGLDALKTLGDFQEKTLEQIFPY